MRVLVTAASRHGSCAEVAEQIGRTLRAAGLPADVRTPDAVADVDGYGAVVLGSAVYYGRWLPAAVDFVRRTGPALAEVPVWLFSVGPVGAPVPQPTEPPPMAAEMVRRTCARDHRVFPGALDRKRLNLRDRLVVSALRAPEGDFRDWAAIRDWAGGIAAELRPAERAVVGA